MRAKGEDDLLRLADRFYEAALRPELWRTVLGELSGSVGADGAVILGFPDSRAGAYWSEGIDELIHHFIVDGWHSNNPRAGRAMPLRNRKSILTEADLFTREELDSHPFNAELVNRRGFRWCSGTIVCGMMDTAVVLSLERLARRERFEATENAIVAALAPHLRRAAELAFHLGDARSDGMLAAFEQTGTAAILLDHLGRVIRMNRQAETLQDGAFSIADGYLLAKARGANGDLQRVIGQAVSPPKSATAHPPTAVLPRQEDRPLAVVGVPVEGAARDIFQRAKAILLLIDPDRSRRAPESILRHVFGLTPAEARLAVAIAHGRGLKQIAETHRVSLGTARAQLKALMAKTDTHRQGELVALLSRFGVVPPQ